MRIKTYFRQGNTTISCNKFTKEDFLLVGDPVTLEYGMNVSSAVELVNRWNSTDPSAKFWVLVK